MKSLFTRRSSFILMVLVFLLLFSSCAAGDTSRDVETKQQEPGVSAIVRNQPVPNFGGFSLERAYVIALMVLRNQKVATYSYWFSMDGLIYEVCPSQGYPIPYSTQLTSPTTVEHGYQSLTTVDQAEPNSLYLPEQAAASWVLCVVDGSMVPVYMEENVQAFPYRIAADRILEPITAATASVKE